MEQKTTTNIIATIGPSSCDKETLSQMIDHNMDMARLNFSWGSYEWFIDVIGLIKELSKEKNKYIPIIQDLSGPRIQDENGHYFNNESKDKIITEKDIADLEFGIKNNVDYIAMSFVGCKDDIVELRNIIKEKGGKQKIIAKIERKMAVDNLCEIIQEADAIMVARGDLGNEFALEEIPFIQHKIIQASNLADKMVIVATQMLLSMVENDKPTRAEVTDIAYAILDGADGIMLSEESAKGKHPVLAIKIMENIARFAEKHRNIIKID